MPTRPPYSSSDQAVQPDRWVLYGACLVFVLGVVRLGWVSDDAFIVARAIRTWVSGHGLGINPGHRVQVFTSPLGFFASALVYFVARDPYAALIVPGLLCSAALALALGLRAPGAPLRAATVLLSLAASRSVLTYSTSGLENSLAHLLLTLFGFAYLSDQDGVRQGGAQRPLGLAQAGVPWFLAALIVLTRLDLSLLVAPPVALALWRRPRATLRASLPALLVLAAWFGFALVYFGFLLPNTAYAKLNTVIPWNDRLLQGISYLVDCAYRDPVLVLGLGVALLACARGPAPARAMAAGGLLYVAYVLGIGGDFMSGRFFTAPYVTLLVAAAFSTPRADPRVAWPAVGVAALLCLPGLSDRRVERRTVDCAIPTSGIVDERECYIIHTSLAQNIRGAKWRTHGYLDEVKRHIDRQQGPVVTSDLIGMGLFGDVRPAHVVERFALSEPLLARITYKPRGRWRVGHFLRPIPAGYLESLRTGENHLRDPCLRQLHARLERVTRGPLLSRARWAAIAALHLGEGTCPPPAPPGPGTAEHRAK